MHHKKTCIHLNIAAVQRGPTTGPTGETILHKSCRLQAAATFFLENAMILGRK